MSMFYVWVLLVSVNPSSPAAQMTTIDNITTQAECERVAKIVADMRGYSLSRCIQVQKVSK